MSKPAIKRKGFTLIELLVVIAIIATLAVVVFVALDPVRRFQEARNSTRKQNVNDVLTAVSQSIVDNKGTLPAGLAPALDVNGVGNGNEYQLGSCANGGNVLCTAGQSVCVNMSADLARYLKTMPIDPGTGASAATTGYSISINANNLITVKSCMAERNEVIEVSR